MEWKINRERIPVTERILDETQEQGVELDNVLPDYDQEIFSIIRCFLLFVFFVFFFSHHPL